MQKPFQIILSVSFLLFFYSCSVNKAKIDNDLKQFYSAASNTEGCFTMLDNATGEIIESKGFDNNQKDADAYLKTLQQQYPGVHVITD